MLRQGAVASLGLSLVAPTPAADIAGTSRASSTNRAGSSRCSSGSRGSSISSRNSKRRAAHGSEIAKVVAVARSSSNDHRHRLCDIFQPAPCRAGKVATLSSVDGHIDHNSTDGASRGGSGSCSSEFSSAGADLLFWLWATKGAGAGDQARGPSAPASSPCHGFAHEYPAPAHPQLYLSGGHLRSSSSCSSSSSSHPQRRISQSLGLNRFWSSTGGYPQHLHLAALRMAGDGGGGGDRDRECDVGGAGSTSTGISGSSGGGGGV